MPARRPLRAIPISSAWSYLADWGWIEGERIAGLAGRSGNVDFDEVEARKLRCSTRRRGIFSIARWTSRRWPISGSEFEEFCRAEAAWLDDYALYAVLRREFNTGAWTSGPSRCAAAIRRRWQRQAAEHACPRALAQEQVLQFAFSRQWNQLREAAARSAIRILGDVAIFVNMDSADVWVHPELFELDKDLKPIRIAGVPPDYFSPTGQRWGNPLYRWDVLASERDSPGGSSAFAAPASSTTSSASTTSAASRPTGRFPPRRRRRSTASGSRRRGSSSSARWKRRWDRCRWWPKTWASSRRRWRRCGWSWECRA
jgi:hypothetical protein